MISVSTFLKATTSAIIWLPYPELMISSSESGHYSDVSNRAYNGYVDTMHYCLLVAELNPQVDILYS